MLKPLLSGSKKSTRCFASLLEKAINDGNPPWDNNYLVD